MEKSRSRDGFGDGLGLGFEGNCVTPFERDTFEDCPLPLHCPAPCLGAWDPEIVSDLLRKVTPISATPPHVPSSANDADLPQKGSSALWPYHLPSESLEKSHWLRQVSSIALGWFKAPELPGRVQGILSRAESPLLGQETTSSEFPGERILACVWIDLESSPASLFLSLSGFG